ncbi:DUF4954 family protein [Alistipes sp.]|uniref:DUF4954 family protein n=1 Tax=Alistipes sp. TaxID=1872444 RepID=UPI003AF1B019
MSEFRKLTDPEIASLERAANTAADWSEVEVTADFSPAQCRASRFEGRVRIGRGARVYDSTVRNYLLGDESLVERVTALECRRRSAFGNGTEVAAMNECAGRTVRIYDALTAQIAYLLAVYRHRPQTIAALERMIGAYVLERTSELGSVGRGARVTGARFVREVRIGDGATIDGATLLENGTLCAGAFVGADVKARDFILAEGARVDNGSILERCFVGESSVLDKGFTATHSLFFANCHCECGEAASVFAGPYTVSHHKSTLLIAGMFSFFNAGSGSNQSNHLFKSGAVHQSVHLRGCKFGSGAYIMSPALEGAFTMVLGHHAHHHDTSEFPYSYLVENDGRSRLLPGANLTSYGAVRDVEKWPVRDRRTLRRDAISFEEYNPYVCGAMMRAVDALNTLADADPDADSYNYKKVSIPATMLRRGLKLYNKAIVASLGAMLERGTAGGADGAGRWLDVGGQFIVKRAVVALLDDVDAGRIATLDGVAARFAAFAERYDDYARDWAYGVLGAVLGHTPTDGELSDAIAAGANARSSLRKAAEEDRRRDCSLDMAVSYGLDADDEQEVQDDYYTVRGLR